MNLNFKRIIDFDKNELSYDILQRCDSDFMYGRFGCKNFESDHPSQNISTFIHFLLRKITLIVLLIVASAFNGVIVASAFGQFCPRSRYRVMNKRNRVIKSDKNDR